MCCGANLLKGDTDASILDGVKIVHRFKFPALFSSIESENVWPSTLFADQVRLSELFRGKIFVLILGLIFDTPLFTFFVRF
jgi:hypothetical protein